MKKYVLMMTLLGVSGTQLSAITPEQVIADGKDQVIVNGMTWRKGTIKALIENAAQLNVLLTQRGAREKALEAIGDLRESMPAQQALKVFDVFTPADWIMGEERPGNIMVGVLYLQQFPEHLTPEVKKHLLEISVKVPPLLKDEIEKLI